MTLDDKQREMLSRALELTRDDEINCDQFASQLAAYVDGNIGDSEALALLDHHSEICPECAEELQILRRALD